MHSLFCCSKYCLLNFQVLRWHRVHASNAAGTVLENYMEICVSSYSLGDFCLQSAEHWIEANYIFSMETKWGKFTWSNCAEEAKALCQKITAGNHDSIIVIFIIENFSPTSSKNLLPYSLKYHLKLPVSQSDLQLRLFSFYFSFKLSAFHQDSSFRAEKSTAQLFAHL